MPIKHLIKTVTQTIFLISTPVHYASGYMTTLVYISSLCFLFSSSDPELVFFGGVVRGESAITKAEEIGNIVEHEYKVMVI